MKRLLVHITRDITELFPREEWGDDEERILRCLAEQMSAEDVLEGATYRLEQKEVRERAPETCPVGPDELRMLYPAHRLAELALMFHADHGRMRRWLQEAGIEIAHRGAGRPWRSTVPGVRPWR